MAERLLFKGLNFTAAVYSTECKNEELWGSEGHSWAAPSGPKGSITRGQCLVSLSGHSLRVQQGHLLWRAFGQRRAAEHASNVAFVSPRQRNRGALCEPCVAQQRRWKTRHGARVMWELKDSIQSALKSYIRGMGGYSDEYPLMVEAVKEKK